MTTRRLALAPAILSFAMAALVMAGLPCPVAADSLETGKSLVAQGKFAEAEAALRSASGTEAQAYLAKALAGQRKFAEAEGVANTVLAASAGQPIATEALGQALIGQEKFDAAIEKLSAALKAKGDTPYGYYWRGQAYYRKKQPDKMIADLEQFLRLAPKAPEASAVQQLLATVR